jgi:hypothetical protein
MVSVSEVSIKKHLQPLSMRLYRVVESQEEVATTIITSNSNDQNLLEDMLENSKPKISDALAKCHYLISTPFRYPPLSHGSRFGSILEPGLFYGSTTIATALAEIAYYRFRFLADMGDSNKVTKHKPQSNHTGFYVNTHSEKGLTLFNKPFLEMQLDSPDSYHASQPFGSKMRKAGVELFKFKSARKAGGFNGGCFNHEVIKSKKPCATEHWQCLMLENRIVFQKTLTKDSFEFLKSAFLIQRKFPIIR